MRGFGGWIWVGGLVGEDDVDAGGDLVVGVVEDGVVAVVAADFGADFEVGEGVVGGEGGDGESGGGFPDGGAEAAGAVGVVEPFASDVEGEGVVDFVAGVE